MTALAFLAAVTANVQAAQFVPTTADYGDNIHSECLRFDVASTMSTITFACAPGRPSRCGDL